MLSLTFKEFMKGNYGEKIGKYYSETDHKLYVIRNGDDILYVGISKSGIWNRWFGGLGRMKKINGRWWWKDLISREIIEHMPESLKYTIELYSLDELFEIFKDEIGERYTDNAWREATWRLSDLEAMMIEKLHPALNVQNNRYGRDPHPEESEVISL